MWTKVFWLKTLEWTIKSAAGSAVAFLTANATGVLDVDFKQAVSVVGLATLVTFFTCIAGNGLGDKSTPSVVPSEETKTSSELPFVGTPSELTPPTDNYDTTGLEVSTTKEPTFPAVEFPVGDEETNIVKGTE